MRRALIAKVNRGLERVLRVEAAEQEPELPLTPEELAAQEQEEQFQRLIRRTEVVTELQRIMAFVPRNMRRMLEARVVARIRELVRGFDITSFPQDLAEFINEVL